MMGRRVDEYLVSFMFGIGALAVILYVLAQGIARGLD